MAQITPPVRVHLVFNPSEGSIATAEATAQFIDDESYSISINKITDGAENNGSNPTNPSFTISVNPTNNTGTAITGKITYTGTALNAVDYTTSPTFSIPNGQSSTSISLNITEDAQVEGTETVIATLSDLSEGSLVTDNATAKITDDEGYSISIAKTTDGTENNGNNPTNAVFTVTVTPANATGSAITGKIAYSGTASNSKDYTTAAKTFSIPNGSSTATITLEITEDSLVEGTETIKATLFDPSEGSIATATATANLNDDESYAISIEKTTDGLEDNSNTATNASFTISVTPQNTSGSAITGNIIYSGTAKEGTDYATGASTFSIADGSAETTIALTVIEDALFEDTETIIATLSNPSQGSLAMAQKMEVMQSLPSPLNQAIPAVQPSRVTLLTQERLPMEQIMLQVQARSVFQMEVPAPRLASILQKIRYQKISKPLLPLYLILHKVH